MTKGLYIYIMLCTVIVSLASCGKQHDAESVVREFMEANISDAASLDDVEFNDIDSTKLVNDSIVNSLRAATKSNATQYRKDINYPSTDIGTCLITLRVTYKLKEKRYSDTYYINKQMTNIVAFKSMEMLAE